MSLEKVFHKDKYSNLPISFISKALPCSRAVGRILIKQEKYSSLATGFMISENLLVTCNYVIPDFNTAANTIFQIDYFVKDDGSFNKYSELQLDPSKFFVTSEELDLTVVAIKQSPEIDLSDRYLSAISLADPVLGENVNLIQHPYGEPLSISLRDGKITEFTALHLSYSSPTEPGSSGAPLFNDQWELMGIHEKSGFLPSLNDPEKSMYTNGGIRISAFMNWFVTMKKNYSETPKIKVTSTEIKKPEDEINLSIPPSKRIDAGKEERDSVFISYAHKDQEKNKWQDRLELHLKTVESIGTRRVWQDGRIQAGSDWKEEIESALRKTKVAVLLIGPNFLNSEFVLNKELPDLLQAAQNEGVRIIPLITHRVAYNLSILSKFQPFYPPAKPLQEQIKNGNAQKILVELVEEIAKVYEAK